MFLRKNPYIIRSRSVFEPYKLSDLLFWNMGDDQSSFTIDASNQISQWNDFSSNGYHDQQGASNQQPLLVQNILNNKSIVRFDGSNDFLVASLPIDYSQLPIVTIFVLFRNLNGGNSNQALFGQDDLGWDRFVLLSHASLGPGISTGSGLYSVFEFNTLNTWQLFSLTLINGISFGSNYWVNDSSVASSFTENHDNSGLSALFWGCIGIESDRMFAKIEIAEKFGFSRVLNTNEINACKYYLKNKWQVNAII